MDKKSQPHLIAAPQLHRELTEEGRIQVEKTTENSKIAGIGGVAKGKVVSLILSGRD